MLSAELNNRKSSWSQLYLLEQIRQFSTIMLFFELKAVLSTCLTSRIIPTLLIKKRKQTTCKSVKLSVRSECLRWCRSLTFPHVQYAKPFCLTRWQPLRTIKSAPSFSLCTQSEKKTPKVEVALIYCSTLLCLCVFRYFNICLK